MNITMLISALSNSADVTQFFERNLSNKNKRQLSTVLASSFSSTGLNKRGALILRCTLRRSSSGSVGDVSTDYARYYKDCVSEISYCESL